MAETLDPIQLAYFDGLRAGLIGPPVIQVFSESLSMHQDFIDDIETFNDFLEIKRLPHNSSSCFELVLPKSKLLELFRKMQADKCLAMTNCFGFDENGKFQIMQKGIMVCNKEANEEISAEKKAEIYENRFEDANGKREIFKGFDLTHKIDENELKTNRERLNAYYKDTQFEKTYHGYALPVDVMVQILSDTDTTKFGNSEFLKVTFGLTGFSLPNISDTLGNFTFYISDINTANASFFVKCSSKLIDGSAGDCPPKTGCK